MVVLEAGPDVLSKNMHYLYRAFLLANVTLADNAPRVLVKSPMACSSTVLADLRAQLKSYKCVCIAVSILAQHKVDVAR